MIWLFLIKPSIILPYNPTILLLRSLPNRNENICPKTDLYGNVHRSFISNNPKLETAQVFINPKMDKKIVVYVYNRVLASTKKEQTIDISNNMNKSQKHYAKWKKIHTKEQNWFYVYKILQQAKFI